MNQAVTLVAEATNKVALGLGYALLAYVGWHVVLLAAGELRRGR